MPRYFFHRTDGGFDPDTEGIEIPDLVAARREAILYAAGTLKDRPDYLWGGGDLRIEVTDEDRALVFTVIMLLVEAPGLSLPPDAGS